MCGASGQVRLYGERRQPIRPVLPIVAMRGALPRDPSSPVSASSLVLSTFKLMGLPTVREMKPRIACSA